jgi:hypothetical protein
MKMQPVLTTVVALLLTTGNVYAGSDKNNSQSVKTNNGNHYAYGHTKGVGQQGGAGTTYTVPEIDAEAGTSALALLAGILLLASEKIRSKRESDKSGIE